jgi:hypothetical protein
MIAIESWLETRREELERAGYALEVRGNNEGMTVIAESPTVIFSLIEWPGIGLEFNAMSFIEDKTILVAKASSHLSVKDKCDYYLSQVEAYIANLS